VHGGKYQAEREHAIMSFKVRTNKVVLVATNVKSKGLDFPDIQHVINYDMPAEIGK
jgi:ATP-dependent RNA helicase DDX41